MKRHTWYKVFTIIFLLTLIAGGGVMLFQQLASATEPLEITLATPAPTATPGAESGESDTPQKVSINRADAWLLDALPGIGPTLAQNIIDYREEHGPFTMIEELLLVPGIGQATYDGVKDYITVE